MSAQDSLLIYIIEDDANIAALVGRYLETAGYEYMIFGDGLAGLNAVIERPPALVILDLMLPKLDGWEVCRQIRHKSDIPILMLTARSEELERVKGLSLGADDYVVKPFSPRELVERVKAILRRARQPDGREDAALHYGGLRIEPKKHRVTLNGDVIATTPSEYKLLKALMNEPGRVFKREDLLSQLYRNSDAVIDRVVDVHIGKLRQKIEPDLTDPRFIMTVRGVGYFFNENLEPGPPIEQSTEPPE